MKILAISLLSAASLFAQLTTPDPHNVPNFSVPGTVAISPLTATVQPGQSIQFSSTVVGDTPTPAPNTLGIFASTGDKTYCVATKGGGLTPYVSVTCRRAGITKCNANTIDIGVFSCGDVLWLFNTQANLINYQAAVNDRDATGNIIGNHVASQGFWQFTNPGARKGFFKRLSGVK